MLLLRFFLWRPFRSPLTRKILALNLLAPLLLLAGLFYLDRYQEELINTELQALQRRAEMVAAAIAEGSLKEPVVGRVMIDSDRAVLMLGRLSIPADLRARLFLPNGDLLIDTRHLTLRGRGVTIEPLPPPVSMMRRLVLRAYGIFAQWQLPRRALDLYREQPEERAAHYAEAIASLTGERARAIRLQENGDLILVVAVPVQYYKQIVGGLLVTASGKGIENSLYEVRLAVLQVAAFALAITVLLSLYLSAAIAVPIRKLALAAEQVRMAQGRRHFIPDLTRRSDEIGELSFALREMTGALWRRMDAIEAFAADVAHELKNPLTSLKSAVETTMRLKDPEVQKKLLAIIQDDIVRMDRLITDISDASRLDAELLRAETMPVSLKQMLEMLVDSYQAAGMTEGRVSLILDLPLHDALRVRGLDGRLAQVFRNVIVNALSFSPIGGIIHVRGYHRADKVVIEIEDDGPGIPPSKLTTIFERFYTERPKDEKFGTHSGLGLAISKQIIEAHHGTIEAANRFDENGAIIGARFTVCLPACA